MRRIVIVAIVTVVIFVLALPLTTELILTLDDWREAAERQAASRNPSTAQVPQPSGPPGPPGPPAPAPVATDSMGASILAPANAGGEPTGTPPEPSDSAATPDSQPAAAPTAISPPPDRPALSDTATSAATASAPPRAPASRNTAARDTSRPAATTEPVPDPFAVPPVRPKSTPAAEPQNTEAPAANVAPNRSSPFGIHSTGGLGGPADAPRTIDDARAHAQRMQEGVQRLQEDVQRMHQREMPGNRAVAGGAPPGNEITRTSELSPGDGVHILWGVQWFNGSVVSVQGNRVRVHYDGWSNNFDESVPLDRIRRKSSKAAGSSAPASSVPSAADQPRTWTDSSGNFQLEATLVGVVDGKAQLRKSDGTLVAIPLEKLSPADSDLIRGRFP